MESMELAMIAFAFVGLYMILSWSRLLCVKEGYSEKGGRGLTSWPIVILLLIIIFAGSVTSPTAP